MPNKFKIKRSYTPGLTPATSELEPHEFAVNWADGIAYVKANDGSIRTLVLGGGGSYTGPSVIIEATSATFPAIGKAGDLYIASVAKTISYWNGSQYIALGGSSSGGGVTPDAPTGLTATAGDSQISLSWTAPAVVGSSAITGYRVEYTPSGGSPTAVNTGSTSTSYTLTGLTNGTAYTARVAAVNDVGTGAYTTASSAITPTAQVFRAIPTLTSNTSNGTAEANTGTTSDAWKLFDGTSSEYNTARNGSDTPKRYFQYTFAGGVKSYIGGYTFIGTGSKEYSISGWELSGSNDGSTFTLLDSQVISWQSGGQTKSFTLASPANYSTYRWTITPDGTSDSYAGLSAVQLTAVPATPVVTISSQPSNQTASSGSATFSVTASATESATLTYQWQKSTDGSTFSPISGATSSSLALSSLTTSDNSSQYRVVVGASGGATSVTSSAATLTVTATSTLTITRGNGRTSTFSGAGTAASPYTRAARVLNSNQDGLADGFGADTYYWTATASGTAYVTVTFYDDSGDGEVANLRRKAGNAALGSAISGGQTVTARSFSVSAGNQFWFQVNNGNTSFANVSVWMV
jgi:hypothetical protein